MGQAKTNFNNEQTTQSGNYDDSDWTHELQLRLDPATATLFANAFSVGYRDDHQPADAVDDIALYEQLNAAVLARAESDSYQPVSMRLYREAGDADTCLLYTSPSPRDTEVSRMPSSA